MAPSPSHQRLALAIVDFLRLSLSDGTIPADDAESVEIASSCIAESFHIDPTDSSAVADALGGQNLLSIYSVYEKLKGKSTASTEGDSSAKEGRPSTPTVDPSTAGQPTPAARAEADALKAQGNAAMQRKDHAAAIEAYTQALALVPLDPIFLSNRAAAYSGCARHADAASDAEMAVAANPAYTKAWSRLGLARFALGDARGSMEAYAKGIEAEGSGGSDVMRRGFETAKRKVEEEEGQGAAGDPEEAARAAGGPGTGGPGGGMPDLASLASMMGGGGGGGGGGGMPDLSQMMNNPMLKQMAQNVMSNPDMMNNILSNPRMREMAQRFGGGGGGGGGGEGGGEGGGGGGGGMPDLASLMQDPNIAELAKSFMGGGAGGAGRGAGQ